LIPEDDDVWCDCDAEWPCDVIISISSSSSCIRPTDMCIQLTADVFLMAATFDGLLLAASRFMKTQIRFLFHLFSL